MLRDSILPFVALRYFPYDFLCVDLRWCLTTEERPSPDSDESPQGRTSVGVSSRPYLKENRIFAIVASAPLLIHFPDCFPPYRRCTPFAVKQAGSLFELKVLQKCPALFHSLRPYLDCKIYSRPLCLTF